MSFEWLHLFSILLTIAAGCAVGSLYGHIIPEQKKIGIIDCQIDQQEHYVGFKLPWLRRLEINYLESSGISYRWPMIKGQLLVILSCLSALAGGVLSVKSTQILSMCLPGAILFSILPFKLIRLYKAIEDQRLRSELPVIFGILGKWASISPDFYFCFGKLILSDVHPKLKRVIGQFLTDLSSGGRTEVAFRKLEQAFGYGLLKEFFICLRQMEKHSGDLVKLIQGFETEALHVEIEVSKRKAEHLKQVLLIHMLNGFGFLFLFQTMSSNKILSEFYIGTAMGNGIITIVATLFVLFFAFSTQYYNEMI